LWTSLYIDRLANRTYSAWVKTTSTFAPIFSKAGTWGDWQYYHWQFLYFNNSILYSTIKAESV
jgi:hypothetical protein